MTEQANASAASTNAELSYPASRLLALAKPEWRTIAVGTVFLLLGAAMGLAYPQAIRVIIDSALGAGDPSLVDKAALAMLAIFAVQGLSMALRSYLFTVAGERIVTRLREHLYAAIIRKEIGFFDQRRTGELTNRLASDTTVLQNTVSVNVSMALRHVAAALGGVVLLFITSPRLTALMLAVVPAVVIGAVVLGRRIRRLSREVQDALATASEVAEETIAGIRTVRSFAREAQESARYSSAVMDSFFLARTRAKLSAAFMGVASFAGYGAVALVLWYGGRLVLDGTMSVGDLTSFLLYTLIVAFAIGALGGLYGDFMRASGAGQRVFALLEDRAVDPAGTGLRPEHDAQRVEMVGVSFAYPSRPDVRVLDDVNLRLEPGEIVALVGPSGAGKSTIPALLARFYEPSAGHIRVGEFDVRELDAGWLREQIGTVSQEPILFSTTIAENIRYGRPDATLEQIHDAARIANADGFVRGFPDGYETLVGERGVQLSGGQKQRIAIARAVLKDPRVLILDEATSALDTESEALVKQALDRLMVGRTTLVIAHRLSTVRDADRVVVMDHGHVVETGTHESLLAGGGLYRRLVERQFEEALH